MKRENWCINNWNKNKFSCKNNTQWSEKINVLITEILTFFSCKNTIIYICKKQRMNRIQIQRKNWWNNAPTLSKFWG